MGGASACHSVGVQGILEIFVFGNGQKGNTDINV